jgi:hypothetical protein
MADTSYNGWTNYETWNVALYIQNEEPLYRIALRSDDYADFLRESEHIRGVNTPDGVQWDSGELDWDELDDMIVELRS